MVTDVVKPLAMNIIFRTELNDTKSKDRLLVLKNPDLADGLPRFSPTVGLQPTAKN